MEQLAYFLVEWRGERRLYAAEKREQVDKYIQRVVKPQYGIQTYNTYVKELSPMAARKTKLPVNQL